MQNKMDLSLGVAASGWAVLSEQKAVQFSLSKIALRFHLRLFCQGSCGVIVPDGSSSTGPTCGQIHPSSLQMKSMHKCDSWSTLVCVRRNQLQGNAFHRVSGLVLWPQSQLCLHFRRTDVWSRASANLELFLHVLRLARHGDDTEFPCVPTCCLGLCFIQT